MPGRKLGYVISVLLLAAVLSAPQVLLAGLMGVFAYSNRIWPLPATVGIHPPLRFNSQFRHKPFWQGGFIRTRWNQTADGIYNCSVTRFDPETAETHPIDVALSGRSGFQAFAIGDRIWFVEMLSKEAYEIIDGVLQKSAFVTPPNSVEMDQQFLWRGDPAVVESTRSGLAVLTLQNGKWNPSGTLALPDFDRERILGGVPINLNLGKSSIQIVQSQQGTHLFLHADGLILYHMGLEFETPEMPDPGPATIADADVPENHLVKTVVYNDENNSPDKVSASDDDLIGWTLVRPQPSQPDIARRTTHGLLIDGQPAALIIDDISAASPTARYYRLDGTTWNEIHALPLEFGSRSCRVVTTPDGLRSYVVAMTSTGAAHFYAVEADQLRQTNASDTEENMGLAQLVVYLALPVAALGLGLLLGAGTWCLMWWFTKPRYEFGVQTVNLASLGWRGFARLIDLSGICLTSLGIGWLMLRNFDWLTFAEAVNLRIDHPTVSLASRVAATVGAVFVITVFAILITQAVWGVTPGKWLCRLRTVRTSLRPIGFARSFAREIVFFVDCANFVCWTPGILSIAFTERRQRLGDLVADTIVVDARSLAPISQPASTSEVEI